MKIKYKKDKSANKAILKIVGSFILAGIFIFATFRGIAIGTINNFFGLILMFCLSSLALGTSVFSLVMYFKFLTFEKEITASGKEASAKEEIMIEILKLESSDTDASGSGIVDLLRGLDMDKRLDMEKIYSGKNVQELRDYRNTLIKQKVEGSP